MARIMTAMTCRLCVTVTPSNPNASNIRLKNRQKKGQGEKKVTEGLKNHQSIRMSGQIDPSLGFAKRMRSRKESDVVG